MALSTRSRVQDVSADVGSREVLWIVHEWPVASSVRRALGRAVLDWRRRAAEEDA